MQELEMRSDWPVYIYALCEPDTGAIRYIGATHDLKQRLYHHIGSTSRTDTPTGRWLKSLKMRKLQPGIITLEVVSSNESAGVEGAWIKKYCEQGANLTNVSHNPNVPRQPKDRHRTTARLR